MDLLVDDNFAYSSSLVLEHNPVIQRAVQQLTLKATAVTSAESKRQFSRYNFLDYFLFCFVLCTNSLL